MSQTDKRAVSAVHALLMERFPRAFPKDYDAIRPLKTGIHADLIKSVSYTHLDVYKRQDHDRNVGAIMATHRPHDTGFAPEFEFQVAMDVLDCLLYTSRCV